MENITQIGIGGIFAILVIREVLGFLSKKNGNGIVREISDLWHWHAPDHDGEQSWKGKRLERILMSLDKNILENTKTISACSRKNIEKLDEIRVQLNQDRRTP